MFMQWAGSVLVGFTDFSSYRNFSNLLYKQICWGTEGMLQRRETWSIKSIGVLQSPDRGTGNLLLPCKGVDAGEIVRQIFISWIRLC